jgi:hypothetical protein
MPGLSWNIGPVGVSYNDDGLTPQERRAARDQQNQENDAAAAAAAQGPVTCESQGKITIPGSEASGWWDGDTYIEYPATAEHCECPPTNGCIAENQTIPSPSSGCPAQSCCPPTENRGGICKTPIGFGTYKTQYMASGSTNGGANFAGHQECNQSNNCNAGGMDIGSYASRCGGDDHWTGGTWDRHIIHVSKRGSWCAPGPAKNSCPTNIGTVVSGAWYGAGGSVQQSACLGGTCDLRLQCTYSLITNPFDPSTVAAFSGLGASDLAGPNGIQKKYCDTILYEGIGSGSPCAGFYTSVTKDYDYQQALRIGQERVFWATDASLFSLIASIAQGTSGITSPLGKQVAQSMILNYCVTQNQNDWPSIQAIRTQINQWVLQRELTIGDDCQLLAADIVSTFCALNTTSPYCDCFNATNFGANIFTACQGKTITPCTDINQMADSFSQAPPWFAPQIATLKSYITPKCAVKACILVKTDPAQAYLAPDVFKNMVCESNIQLCLASVTVHGSMLPGATINQSCSASIGITSTVPTSPGGSAGCPAPVITPTGLSGNLQVVAQGNSPTGPTTFAVVGSPSGSTTEVQTTGAQGGGLAQTITSSAPGVSLQSSGSPVTQTLIQGPIPSQSPGPSPVPSPGPSPVTSAGPTSIDNTQKYALAAGGIVGLSSSFFAFIVFIIILFLVFGGKKNLPKPRVIPLSAYGL